MNEHQKLRFEMARVFRADGARPAALPLMTRRIFLHKSLLLGAAGAATYGFFPFLNVLDVAFAADGETFRFAWISDTHLYPKEVNTRFVDKTVRAIEEVKAMKPARTSSSSVAISPSLGTRSSFG